MESHKEDNVRMCDEDGGGGNVGGWGRKIETLWQLLESRFCSIWWCLIVLAHKVFVICKRKVGVKTRLKVTKVYVESRLS